MLATGDLKPKLCFSCMDCNDECNCGTGANWIMDSGTFKHFTSNLDDFSSYEELLNTENAVVLMVANLLSIVGKGVVIIRHNVEDHNTQYEWTTHLYPVFYVPSLTVQLLSMGMFLKKQNHVVGFANKIHLISQKGKTIMMCTPHTKTEDMIYYAFTHIENPESLEKREVAMSIHFADYQVWHRHLGHMNDQALVKLPQCTINCPEKIYKQKCTPICLGCMEGKMTSKSFPDSDSRVNENFELIHSDLKTLPVDSYHLYKYFIVFVDDKSSAYWIQCLKLKFDASKVITNFEAQVRVQYKSMIRRWHIDAGGEFVNLKLDDTLKSLGIHIKKSVPYMHQQNGCSECAIRTIMEKAQALQFTACLPQSWWEFCVEHTVHLHNLTPIAHLQWHTPHEEIKGEKPNVSMLKVFGCGTYVYLPKEK